MYPPPSICDTAQCPHAMTGGLRKARKKTKRLLYAAFPVLLSACGGGGGGESGSDSDVSSEPSDRYSNLIINLSATAVSPSSVELSWNAVDPEARLNQDYPLAPGWPVLYSVYKDDLRMEELEFVSTLAEGLVPESSYCFRVVASAFVYIGFVSGAYTYIGESSEVCATTLQDTAPPTAPTAPRVSSSTTADISITWSPATDDGLLEGYKVYRNGAFKQDVSTTSFTDNEVSLNTDYCYEFSAFDSAGNESARSIEVCASTDWTPTVEISGIYGPTSLALDSSGNAHIAYADPDTQELRYATNAGGGWNTTLIDTNVYSSAALAIDAADNAHISYFAVDGDYSLKYATNRSGQWTTTTVDSANGNSDGTDIVVDASGNAHISYGIKYATNASGQWISETIDSSNYSGLYTSMALDSKGRAHIAYREGRNHEVRYVTNESGTWVSSSIGNSGNGISGPSIGVDSMDKVHIAYWEPNDLSLKCASNSGGAWVTSTIEGYGAGRLPSLAVDAEDSVHISYSGSSDQGLRYATDSSGSWDIHILLPSYAAYSSIAIDKDGRAHLSWYEASEIKYGIYSVH